MDCVFSIMFYCMVKSVDTKFNRCHRLSRNLVTDNNLSVRFLYCYSILEKD